MVIDPDQISHRHLRLILTLQNGMWNLVVYFFPFVHFIPLHFWAYGDEKRLPNVSLAKQITFPHSRGPVKMLWSIMLSLNTVWCKKKKKKIHWTALTHLIELKIKMALQRQQCCVARSDVYLPSTQTSPNRPNPVQQDPNQSLYLKDKYSAAFSYKWCKQIPQATRGPRKNEWLATTMSFRTPRCSETAWDKNITNHIYFFL